MYEWVVFLHIVGALGFFTTHGVSVVIAYRLRGESNLDRIRLMLELSRSTLMSMFAFYLILLVAGVIAGFMGSWWNFGWPWLSLGLMLLVFGWMAWYARKHYAPLRKAVGLPYLENNKEQLLLEPRSAEEINAIIQGANPHLLSLVGFGVPLIVLWLMVFKPF
jgi:hypothetical protein